MTDFRKQLEHQLNIHGKDSEANTPDHLLAAHLEQYTKLLISMLDARDRWSGHKPFFDKVNQSPADPKQFPAVVPICKEHNDVIMYASRAISQPMTIIAKEVLEVGFMMLVAVGEGRIKELQEMFEKYGSTPLCQCIHKAWQAGGVPPRTTSAP